jgi:alpha-glucosidase
VAVAELWTEPSARKARYATKESLGQAFYFDILHAGFSAAKVRTAVEQVMDWTSESGSACTWVLSNHDNVRHATRFGLPDVDSTDVWANFDRDRRWLLSGGTDPVEDVDRGLRRARALTAFLMALPGSLYLYQGEELGLREVADIPADKRQDPIFFRSPGFNTGRDGCRVPLPWSVDGPSYGFGSGEAHLPQPAWFAHYAVELEESDPDSTLNLYRTALKLRRELQSDEALTWVDAPAEVLHIQRPGGWQAITNFAPESVPWSDLGYETQPEVLLATGPLNPDSLPAETTIWLKR